ncbi:ABC transporter permease [Nitratireductor indicus]|uniref:Dipeptide/oligopeptide/nickel ABC transporter permease n=1 Tax=Nitratireductor indicus C115 TaxID=1231190 RepID=K2PM70_9HYPH|nr:ABC transporter permease [Nitratireductor indicus]EKF42167.1 dipeptide/oligopeptide/nickel ABC transporter permease [Nitratireductor indicus C115]MDS1136245.1 ABC transporter permease [Nitratireductor indicus]SFQ61495.1 peptide/nickel transport system permease protein [Nitratireductor indicus]
MGFYLLKRLLASILTALLASVLVFLLVRLVPGDVVSQMMGQAGGETAETAMRQFFGLDQPIYVQYAEWLMRVLQGDLGTSWTRGIPVTQLLFQAFFVTLEIGLLTLLIATLVGIPLGIVAAIYEGKPLDNLIQGFNILGLSAPVFWVGLMLLVGISATVSWSPPLRYMPPTRSLSDNLEILLLPILSLGLLQAAAYSQFVRQNVLSALHQEYVRTAIAKGVPVRLIFFKHILRNVLIPIVTFMGLILVQILGGVVIVESLFALPGLGRLLLTAIETRDYPIVQGALLIVVAAAMVVNLLVDLTYRLIDPRVRVS